MQAPHTTLTYGVDTALAKIDTVISDARPAREADKLSIDTHGFTLEPQTDMEVVRGIIEVVRDADATVQLSTAPLADARLARRQEGVHVKTSWTGGAKVDVYQVVGAP